MKRLQGNQKTLWRRAAALIVIAGLAGCLTACSHAMMMMHGGGAKPPAITEFGLGPRVSANGLYKATLEPSRELRPRQMQTVRVAIVDEAGRAVEGATLTIDGGMPQHGHGLPTRPRMTRAIGDGTYEVEGVRFNMGGWWEFKVTIASERGNDTVTFNLSL
jgi:YtkA-like